MKNLQKLNIKLSFLQEPLHVRNSSNDQMYFWYYVKLFDKNSLKTLPQFPTPLTTLDRLGKQEPQRKTQKEERMIKKRLIEDDKQWKTYSSPKEAMSGNNSWSTWILKN